MSNGTTNERLEKLEAEIVALMGLIVEIGKVSAVDQVSTNIAINALPAPNDVRKRAKEIAGNLIVDMDT